MLDKKVNLIDPVYKKHLFLGQDFWVSRVQISEFCNKEQNTFSDHCWVLLITSISNFYLKLLSQTRHMKENFVLFITTMALRKSINKIPFVWVSRVCAFVAASRRDKQVNFCYLDLLFRGLNVRNVYLLQTYTLSNLNYFIWFLYTCKHPSWFRYRSFFGTYQLCHSYEYLGSHSRSQHQTGHMLVLHQMASLQSQHPPPGEHWKKNTGRN